jgi:protein dithiol oxidoreductase (disulfide-forming)
MKLASSLVALALLVFGCLTAAVHAQDVRSRENLEYRVIAPQPVETGERIEVIDFFWYGCPYCYELQPGLDDWIRRKSADVEVRRIPVVLRDTWAPHARIWYTLELLGEAERLHAQVYRSYHFEELHMSKPDVMERWAVKQGIDRRRWLDAYYSPEVDARIARAAEATKRYEIQGTPTIVVDGRYLTSSSMTPTVRGVLPVVDDLVRLARERRSR